MHGSWADICDEESDVSAASAASVVSVVNVANADSGSDDECDLLALSKLQIKEPPKVEKPKWSETKPKMQKLKVSKKSKKSNGANGPDCYCGEPSKFDTIQKPGKREPIGTEFVVCASGTCKYWWPTPVPADLPTGKCFCERQAAACKVKKVDSPLVGKMILTCAFSKCKFYKVV